MTQKVAIITGANAGIGKQAAMQLATAGYTVVLGCRSMQRGAKALTEIKQASHSDDVVLLEIDLSLQASVRRFAEAVKEWFPVVDVLIHNAAIFDIAQKQAKTTREGYETVWMTNHVNPVYLTALLLEPLKQSENGRVITIASKGLLAKPGLRVDLQDPEFKRRKFSMSKAYYQSKLAQIMFTYALADKLKDTRITVNCIRVTAVQVDISRHPGLSAFSKWIYQQKSKRSLTPAQMAKTYTYLATSEDLRGTTGTLFDEKNQPVHSSAYSADPNHIKALMQLTAQYIAQPDPLF